IILDVDGVLTDGRVLVNEEGEQWRSFNVKDGYAIQYAIKQGIQVIVITGGRSMGILKRFSGLGVQEVYLNISDKLSLLKELQMNYEFAYEECLCIGGDVRDVAGMRQVGEAVCRDDAAEELTAISHDVSIGKGGDCIVSETI